MHVPTGLPRLDAAGLLEPGIVTTLLAAAGENKTTWAFQFLRGCAEAGHRAIGYFPEDPRAMLSDRLLSEELDVDSFRLRRLKAGSDIPGRLAAVRLPWARLVSVDDGRYDARGLRANLEGRLRETGARLVVVDYLQAALGRVRSKDREEQISDFLWDAGALGKKYGAAILVLSQIRQEVMERGRKLFDDWRWKNPGRTPTEEAIVGYRPAAFDGAHAPTAIFQMSRALISSFRPTRWLRAHGTGVKDNVIELNLLKNNYSPFDNETLRFEFVGGRIRERQ